ncbi:MAG: hypothetical protein KDI13_11325, partial [Alphaproteobacteria bacterium]|nr:hypothetical protein [Alphaproteobacteria bacterium]
GQISRHENERLCGFDNVHDTRYKPYRIHLWKHHYQGHYRCLHVEKHKFLMTDHRTFLHE